MKYILPIILFLSFEALAADTNALPVLTPAYGELPPTLLERPAVTMREHPVGSLLGVLILLTLTMFVLWRILHPKPAPGLPPEKIARDALALLQAQPEDGKLLSKVSQILKRYVGAASHFQGAQMTTAEFTAALAGNAKVSPQLSEALLTLLRACDKDKFAARNVAPPLNAVSRALELVERVENETHRQDACATAR